MHPIQPIFLAGFAGKVFPREAYVDTGDQFRIEAESTPGPSAARRIR
jgi:hypothetical protein